MKHECVQLGNKGDICITALQVQRIASALGIEGYANERAETVANLLEVLITAKHASVTIG